MSGRTLVITSSAWDAADLRTASAYQAAGNCRPAEVAANVRAVQHHAYTGLRDAPQEINCDI
jgi:acetoin utilization deacetylase AcuC-like enzyme